MPSNTHNPLENCTINHLAFRTLLVTALALTGAQASFAAGGTRYQPPSGRDAGAFMQDGVQYAVSVQVFLPADGEPAR